MTFCLMAAILWGLCLDKQLAFKLFSPCVSEGLTIFQLSLTCVNEDADDGHRDG